MSVKCNIRKDDRVEVITGKNKGKIGKVKKVVADKARVRVIVEGVNMVTRNTKAPSPGAPSGRIEKEAPLHISNVALLCPKCNERSRVGHMFVPQVGSDKPRKVRFCKKCKEHIDEK
ncbi:MAG: 50S ribosomal protein L24 [Candidatus Adiutrix sp.]|jgi:large subunit ribosomal protein L24|nr:50S ribosomal protein L24 [Candidatus Adiutrix sp.]